MIYRMLVILISSLFFTSVAIGKSTSESAQEILVGNYRDFGGLSGEKIELITTGRFEYVAWGCLSLYEESGTFHVQNNIITFDPPIARIHHYFAFSGPIRTPFWNQFGHHSGVIPDTVLG